MQIEFESMQVGQVVSSRFRRSFVRLNRSEKDNLGQVYTKWHEHCLTLPFPRCPEQAFFSDIAGENWSL